MLKKNYDFLLAVAGFLSDPEKQTNFLVKPDVDVTNWIWMIRKCTAQVK